MKALVVARSDALKNLLAYHLKPLGFEVFYYSDPVKVLESLEELDPEMILASAVDFPRHWKTLIKVLREKRSKEECVFVLLAGSLPFEEAAKATHLGVNGIVGADLSDKQQVRQLAQLYRRYRSVKDQRCFHRLVLTARDRVQLVFVHPRNLSIVTGSLAEISIQGAGFKPTDVESTADLRRGEEIPLAALRVGEDIVTLVCRVSRNRGELGLQFTSFESGGHHKLFRFIRSRVERELKEAIARPAPEG
jgi:methylmalonyl-CoA mutase cobalamin-binding subunit